MFFIPSPLLPFFPHFSQDRRHGAQINFCLSSLGPTNSLAQAMPMKPRALKMVMSLLKDLGRQSWSVGPGNN